MIKHAAKRFGAAAVIAVACAIPTFAQDQDFVFRFEGPRRYNSFIPSGADLSLTYSGFSLSPQADTLLYLLAGAGYESGSLPRDPITGDPWSSSAEGNTYDALDIQWAMAFIQGLSRRDDGGNLVEVFAYYRGRYDVYKNDLVDSVFADVRGIFDNSLMGGASYDSRTIGAHRSKQGLYAEATAEWGPGFVNGDTDFWRVSSQLRGFLPVYDIPNAGGNLFNAYLAGFAGIDYADGSSVPVYVSQSFGGRTLRGSLGDCVRGYGWNKFDTAFKSVANVELRLLGPTIGVDFVVPLLYAFADAGWYSGFAESTNHASESGFLASCGGGAALDVADAIQLGVYGGLRLLDDTVYYPADAFFWSIMLFAHFK